MALIVIEGIDGSGKSTQLELLGKFLKRNGISYEKLSFPRYECASGAPVAAYLRGDYGKGPMTISPYTASLFYATDRVASYLDTWKEMYLSNRIIISDRYTTSNAIHQGSKLEGYERYEYMEWLFDFEYKKLGIPSPDLVILLDTPLEVCLSSVNKRNTGKDIHESDENYLRKCYSCAQQLAATYDWIKLATTSDGVLFPPEEINRQVIDTILEMLDLREVNCA